MDKLTKEQQKEQQKKEKEIALEKQTDADFQQKKSKSTG